MKHFPCFLLLLALFAFPHTVLGDTDAVPFYPTWKLMSADQKQQFIAGYIQGWRDAAQVTTIAIGYVKENPNKALEGLEQIRDLYDLKDIRPAALTTAVDLFFQQPENRNAGLSQAVSAGKQALIRK